jgi:hypothetical protein
MHLKYISIYIQQDAMLHSLFIFGNCSAYFGWYFHPSSGVLTTVSTASGICHTVTAICRYRGRVETGVECAVGGVCHSNNITVLEYTTDTSHKVTRGHRCKNGGAPDDGHGGVRNM